MPNPSLEWTASVSRPANRLSCVHNTSGRFRTPCAQNTWLVDLQHVAVGSGLAYHPLHLSISDLHDRCARAQLGLL